ncbi:hypothetical protein [Paenibacillus sp. NPDC058071]|uniref:hypothetical protein n=1 Tax=Paenibacillus sp. NPDC058071 TaxID=3346326 RepID=UPI0036D98ACA
MRKSGIWIGAVLLFVLLAGCSNNAAVENEPSSSPAVDNHTEETAAPEQQPAEQQPDKKHQEEAKPERAAFKQLESVFGFADESGEQLITIPSESGADPEHPEQFKAAIGNNGQWIEIEFVRLQEANEQDNGRQNMYNFNNMKGCVYKAKNGKFAPDKSYLLVKDAVIGKGALIDLKSATDSQSPSGQYLPADAETIAQVEAIKKRKVKASSLLAESAEEKIALFVFERQGDDMLASIAYIKRNAVLFKDYPAKYDEFSTWRVDSGDEPGLFEVLFLARSDEGLLLGISWGAPEGESLSILKEADGALQETDLHSGRYWSPV